MGRIAAAFAGTLLGIYLLLGVTALLLLPTAEPLPWLALAVLHECLLLGIAIELTELLFGLLLPARVYARTPVLDRARLRVAVLYLCCDDVDDESLDSLRSLRDVDVFVLDDSRTEASRRQTDRSGFTVIRRSDRAAFKAGNLNHWLRAYGERYEYFIVLDSDSVIFADAVWELVEYAEASENRDVAIVQSTIVARADNRFQRCLAVQAPLRNRILSRLYDAIGWTLSHGHNALHRTAAIRSAGGFDISASCEDTATSLRLLHCGWRIILVPTVSYDAEPRDIVAFRRRYVRWARQTIDVIAAMKLRVRVSSALLMVRHVLGYLLPIVGTASLVLFLVGSPRRLAPGVPSISAAAQTLGSVFAVGLATSIAAILLLRLVLSLRAGQSVKMFLASALLNGAAVAFCSPHTALGMLRSLARGPVAFRPTGAAAAPPPTCSRLWLEMAGAWAVYVAVAVIAMRKPFDQLGTLPLFWLVCFVGSPPLLWLFHRDQRVGAA
ncbi:MAG TPA: glycosyltransferase family 2 protein [Thermoanaerobaculia bacterium]|nr:glycosyltransferase family 2 protein [Thermoanaerobaculia bacterium]